MKILLAYLPTLFTFSLLRPAMDPVVVDTSLFPVLTDSDVPEGRLTGEPYAVHQYTDTTSMRHYLTRRTLHP